MHCVILYYLVLEKCNNESCGTRETSKCVDVFMYSYCNIQADETWSVDTSPQIKEALGTY